jgi:hypothetical protein
MEKIFPYKECENCEFIEDCPHPTVDDEGHPVPPEECLRKNSINLKKRKNENRKSS